VHLCLLSQLSQLGLLSKLAYFVCSVSQSIGVELGAVSREHWEQARRKERRKEEARNARV